MAVPALVALFLFAPSARAATLVSGTVSGTWTSSGNPYVVTGSLYVEPGATLAVEPGVVVKFHFGTGISVDGALDVNGTASEKAVFTSVKDDLVDGVDSGSDGPTVGAPGDWNSIQFYAGSSGSFDHAIVRNGGWTCFTCPFANVANRGGAVALANSRVSRSAAYGIRQMNVGNPSTIITSSELDSQEQGIRIEAGAVSISGSNLHDNDYAVFYGGSQLTLTGNVFSNNATAPARIGIDTDFVHSGNVASGSFRNGFIMEGTLPSGVTRTWTADIPYVVQSVYVSSGANLIVSPGAVIKSEFNGSLSIDGALQVNGSAQDKAYFTTVKDDLADGRDSNNDGPSVGMPESWNAIVFNAGSSGTITNAIIRFGGYTCFTCKWANVANNGGTVTITDSEIASSGFYGLRQTNASASTAVHGSSITGNSQYGVFNDTAAVVDATNNWWGDASGPFHPTLNAAGAGNRVSDFVDFDPWLLQQPGGAIKVAIILADLADVQHAGPSTLTQPCKLLDSDESYASNNPDPVSGKAGYAEYFEDLFYCVSDYFAENSYGEIRFSDTIVNPNSDEWFALPETQLTYAAASPSILISHAIAAAGLSTAVMEQYDAITVVHSGISSAEAVLHKDNYVDTVVYATEPARISIAEHDALGSWVHELGHVVGLKVTDPRTALPDLYNMGNVRQWDLMAEGSFNGGAENPLTGKGNGRDPAYLSSFIREFAGWMKSEQTLPKSVSGIWDVYALATSQSGDSIFRYNLEESTAATVPQYYILESRHENLGRWDSTLPTAIDPQVVLYRVNTHGREKYGYKDNGGLKVEDWSVAIPQGNWENGLFNDGLLRIGETFRDEAEGVSFTATGSFTTPSGKYGVHVDIQPINGGNYTGKRIGAIIASNESLRHNIPANDFHAREIGPGESDVQPSWTYQSDYLVGVYHILLIVAAVLAWVWVSGLLIYLYWRWRTKAKTHGFVRKLLKTSGLLILAIFIASGALFLAAVRENSVNDPGSERVHSPWQYDPLPSLPRPIQVSRKSALDIDLHVYCHDGRHVGMNYATGKYEVQIADAITNGDNQGAPEWILFPPEGNEGCKHVVSARDNAAFLTENPDLAAQLTDTSDSYNVYARYIDPASGIYTSTTLENQSIQPGASVVHAVSGTTDVSIGAGVVDATAPTTTAALSGTQGANGWYVSPVSVTLSADDGADGTGVASTEYSLDGGLNWTTYAAPFVLSDDGMHTVLFGSRDNAGNGEQAQTLEVKIDGAAPDTLIDSAPSSTTGSTSATFAFHATEAATFECRLDSGAWAPCTSPVTFTGLAVGIHAFDVRATDQAGNVDPTPVSTSWTVLATGTVRVTFQRHTVQQGTNPGSTKAPISGATVSAYTKASGSCASSIGSNPHDYGTVLATCTPDASAITDTNGIADVTVLPGDYIMISQDPQTSIVAGVSSGTVAAGETADKFLQVIVRANGTSVPGKTTTRTGSLLHIIEPEYVEWSQTQELYPFVFDAPSGDWDVTVTVTPPEGFTADYSELSTDVNNDYKALQFTLTDVGSCWECGTGVELAIRHKGRTERIKHNIPTPMTKEFVRQKGLKVKDLEDRGVWVTRKGKVAMSNASIGASVGPRIAVLNDRTALDELVLRHFGWPAWHLGLHVRQGRPLMPNG